MKWELKSRKLLLTVFAIIVVILASFSVYFLDQYFQGQSKACSTPPPTPYISEYCVSNKLSSPNAIAVDSHGNVWFVAQGEAALGVLYSSNSSIHIFQIPNATKNGVQSWGIAVDNTRNLVWFTNYAGNEIINFSILTKRFISYNVTSSSFAGPQQIVLDSKGNVWFTELYSNYIGEITTAGQEYNFKLPLQLTSVPFSGPEGLTFDKNGTLWFTDPIANSIGSYNNNLGTFQVYNLTGKVESPIGIAVDSQGNVWMTEHGPSLVAEFNPSSHFFRAITTHIPPYHQPSLPYFVYIDSAGNVWFNEHQGNAIARFAPINNSLVEFVIPTQVYQYGNISGALTMTLSPNGTPWFTEVFGGKIGRVNIQFPIGIGISFQNSSFGDGQGTVLSSGRTISLKINVTTSVPVNLSLFLSSYNYNSTLGFNYIFSPPSGKGNFTSQLSIEDEGLARGTYYLTVSALSNNLIVSRILQVNAS